MSEKDENESVKLKFEDPEKNTGVVYLSVVPPMFNAKKVRDALSAFGEIGRIFLQVIRNFSVYTK